METDAVKLRQDVEALAQALSKVLYCSTCKGKGSIWVRNAKDKPCACRIHAKKVLVEVG